MVSSTSTDSSAAKHHNGSRSSFGFSLIAPPNATTTLALVASAFSVAGAIFLILELDHSFGGLIRIPSEPMINVLSHLAK